MNIFYVDEDPCAATVALCDKHVVKMTLESAQILSTVRNIWKDALAPYSPTHVNHPCVKWAGISTSHYEWLWSHATALSREYTNRYGRIHACDAFICRAESPPKGMYAGCFWEPPLCMPEQYWQDSIVESYRAYYRAEKRRFAAWRLGNVPIWFNEGQS